LSYIRVTKLLFLKLWQWSSGGLSSSFGPPSVTISSVGSHLMPKTSHIVCDLSLWRSSYESVHVLASVDVI